jgi:hypothetical protein
MKPLSKILFACILCIGCNTKSTLVSCSIDSVYKKPVLTVEDQISPTWVYVTKCGNIYSMYKNTYKKGDSIQVLKK